MEGGLVAGGQNRTDSFDPIPGSRPVGGQNVPLPPSPRALHQIVPGVFDLPGNHRTLPAPCPDPPQTPLWTLERGARVMRQFGFPAMRPLRCASCGIGWVGVARSRWAEPWNATKPPSPPGSARPGRHKKKARAEGRTIVFIDESGLTQKPHCVRTWSPKGQTPLLFHCFNWKNLGATLLPQK